MNRLSNKTFEGERALFMSSSLSLSSCVFQDGESPLKESRDLEISSCSFLWKYPLWYCDNVTCSSSLFSIDARAGIWYTKHAKFDHCDFSAPKLFRKCEDISISSTCFPNGEETLWWCENIALNDVTAKGAYFGMKSRHLMIQRLHLEGGYCFDGCEDIEISDSTLLTKDAFWNCKNVVCRYCHIECEYFGWNSENVTLINCTIKSHQGFCYMKNIKLIDCKIEESDLIFEYCEDIDATIHSRLGSVKNPISGIIRCQGIDELIQDDPNVDHAKTIYETL